MHTIELTTEDHDRLLLIAAAWRTSPSKAVGGLIDRVLYQAADQIPGYDLPRAEH